MKISIITVCYNSAKTLENTIQSVLAQTHPAFEYIIVDGNSTDGTLDIIKKYSHSKNLKWISEPDQGLYDAMNKGIKLCSGEYIGILNSDDLFYSDNTLQEVNSFLEQHPQQDAITGNIVQHRDGKIIREYSSKKWTPEKLKIGFMPPHPSIFIKKSIFEKYGLYTLGYKIAADYEMIIRFFLKNKISFLYSGITTTSMLVGGASSSGLTSYKTITKEIEKAFAQNKIKYSPIKVKYRALWKFFDFI